MAQEIEIKFILDREGTDALRQQLNMFCTEHSPAGRLLNIYYETPDSWLRRHDMGLRIRGDRGRYEMTMKVAGRVVGGLHQRPEYNIALSAPELALEQFPAEVWPNGAMPADLALQVQPLFSTDFDREKWIIHEGDSRIEVALDLGEVTAGALQEPIGELELELLSGHTRDVLRCAQRLLGLGSLRQGSLSKAARGYHLAQGNAERKIKPMAAQAGLEAALAHWQYHEELWLRGNDAAKAEIRQAIEAIRQALTSMNDTAAQDVVALLSQCDVLLASSAVASAVAFDRSVTQVKLWLTAFLVTGDWHTFSHA